MDNIDAIEWLKEIPKKFSNRLFLIDDISGNNLTFNDLDIAASKIGSYLLSRGLKKSDRVAIIMNNSQSLVKFYFGCLYVGIVVVPVNPILTTQEIEYIINHCKAKMILVSQDTYKKINSKFFQEKGIFTVNLVNNDTSELETEKITNLNVNEVKKDEHFESFRDVTSNDEMAIVYTSGTTAEPKGVVHKISDFIDNGREFGKSVGINSENRFCNMLALTYLGGYYNLLLIPYVNGASVVLTHTFDPQSIINFWKPIIKQKVNTLWLVPSIISILLEFDRGDEGQKYCSENIKFTLAGTAPLPIQFRLNFEKRYGVKIYENYGMTETFFISTNSPKGKVKNGSVGRILPSVEIRIVHNEKILPVGQEGQIQVKSPHLMKGYFEHDNENIEAVDGSWFDTGDIGYLSDEKEVFLTGRKKDLIIRGGINISPASIENIIYKHTNIRECAVIGIPHKFQGEEIVAVVSLKSLNNFEIIKKELFELTRNELSSIKQPSQIVQLSELPHTTSGKIQKGKIQAWFLKSLPYKEKEIERKKIQKQILKKRDFLPSKIVERSIQALSIKYNTIVYEMQRKGEDVIVLSLGEAFFDIPLFSFNDLPFPKIYHYSHSRGIPELREKIAQYFVENYDVTFDSEREILITAGSKIAIHMALMTLIDPGDEVIIYEPAWVSFPEQIKLCYGIPVQIPHHKSVFDFEDYISEKTKVIIVNNPNNPTGRVFNLEEMSFIYNLARKYNLFVISDEAYSDFVTNRDEFISFANLDTEKKHTIVVNSISKNFGISGWRLGYMISNADLINQTLKINQHLITCPATILEYYVEKHFDDIIKITKPQILELVKKRNQVEELMNSLKLNYLKGSSTYYFFVSIDDSNLSSEEFCTKLLNDYHVSTAPGIGYGKSCDSFIRVGIGSENLKRINTGLNAIKDLIQKTSK